MNSRIRETLLNLDSRNATFNVEAEFSTWMPSAKPTNCTFNLQTPLYGVTSMSLKSIELPVLNDNIRPCNYTDVMGMSFLQYAGTNNQYIAVQIPVGNYTTTTALVGAVNSAFASLALVEAGVAKPTISYDLISDNVYKMVITWSAYSTGNSFYVQKGSTNLMYVLGFTGDEVMSATGTLTATFGPNLNHDNFYNIVAFSNQFNVSSINYDRQPATFKVPITASKGAIQFWGEGFGFKQRRELEGGATTGINSITIQITDRYGYSVPCLAHFSLLLGLEMNNAAGY